MEREIIFRGYRKHKDEWAYGSLIVSDDCTSIWSNDLIDDVEVIPETVGQYTGLNDKNGNKIFEGDIVKFKSCEPHLVLSSNPNFVSGKIVDIIGKEVFISGRVYFDGGCFNVIYKNDYGETLYNRLIEVDIISEIISNIHDNPEILKNEE